jgi:hypothetical protein
MKLQPGDLAVYTNPFSPPHAGELVKVTASAQGRYNLQYLKDKEEFEFGVSERSLHTLEEYGDHLNEIIEAAEVLKLVIQHYRSEQNDAT